MQHFHIKQYVTVELYDTLPCSLVKEKPSREPLARVVPFRQSVGLLRITNREKESKRGTNLRMRTNPLQPPPQKRCRRRCEPPNVSVPHFLSFVTVQAARAHRYVMFLRVWRRSWPRPRNCRAHNHYACTRQNLRWLRAHTDALGESPRDTPLLRVRSGPLQRLPYISDWGAASSNGTKLAKNDGAWPSATGCRCRPYVRLAETTLASQTAWQPCFSLFDITF